MEKVFASRRTRESRGSFDNANEHARQREEERLAKRQKPKRKKFKVVMICVEIKSRRVRAESSPRPPRHRRDACSMAWRCRFLTARPSQDGRVIAEK